MPGFLYRCRQLKSGPPVCKTNTLSTELSPKSNTMFFLCTILLATPHFLRQDLQCPGTCWTVSKLQGSHGFCHVSTGSVNPPHSLFAFQVCVLEIECRPLSALPAFSSPLRSPNVLIKSLPGVYRKKLHFQNKKNHRKSL